MLKINNIIRVNTKKRIQNSQSISNKTLFRNFYTKKYVNKNIGTCNFVIPANIFQTWESKKLPPHMMQNILSIKLNNPKFNYYLFDDNDCREFIRRNFRTEVLKAYDSLIPGAYKADLWRYCILYKKGGIYMDIKYKPINEFKLYNLLEKEHWVLDVDGHKIYNAIIVCKPGNEILLKAINKICENVKNKYYGNNALEPTGPALLKKIFSEEDKENIDMKHIVYGINDNRGVEFNGYNVFKCYDGYFSERQMYASKEHYAALWEKRKVYL